MGTSLNKKPAELLDPRPVLRCTMPANARFRHGISFLTEPSDEQLALFDQDERKSGEDALDPSLDTRRTACRLWPLCALRSARCCSACSLRSSPTSLCCVARAKTVRARRAALR